MTKIKLRAHSDLDGVDLYYDDDNASGDRYYYSRNGKQFYPKSGEDTILNAEEAATESDVKKRAAKRTAPYLPMAGGTGADYCIGTMLGNGVAYGFSLRKGKEGLVFKGGLKEHTLTRGVYGFAQDHPAVKRLIDLTARIKAAESLKRALESQWKTDLDEHGTKLPSIPHTKEGRVPKEDKLAAIVASLRVPENRVLAFAVVQAKNSWNQVSLPKPDKVSWDHFRTTSVSALLVENFGGCVWKKVWRAGQGKRRYGSISHGYKELAGVTWLFKQHDSVDTFLIVRDVPAS